MGFGLKFFLYLVFHSLSFIWFLSILVYLLLLGGEKQLLGGPIGTSKIYKSTFKFNIRIYAALYMEEEYEELVIEAHYTCKGVVNDAKIGMNVFTNIVLKGSKREMHSHIT